VSELAFDSYDADVGLTPDSDSARYKIRVMDGILREMHATAAAHGAPLVLIPIPHPLDVGGHPTGEVDRAKYPDYAPERMTRTLEEIAERRGIPYVDLFGPFAARGSAELYFRGLDDHWNDVGQDYAAKLVAESLAAQGLLAPLEQGSKHDGRR
jgi:lysophospholipase L1-like esterase